MRINKKLIERIMDRPFTVRWLDEHPKLKKTDSRSLYIYPNAYVSVEGLSDMFIIVDEDFRIDVAGAKLGERQKEYLSVHYYDISAKLMELYGMSSDEIEVYLKKLKAERNLDVEDFLREFKPKYKKVIYKFSSFVKRHHLALWYYHHDEDNYPKKILEDSWEKFYTGGIYFEEGLCYFNPDAYLYMIGKHDIVDPNEWTEFVNRNISYSTTIKGDRCYTLQDLDKAFEKFESSLGKVEESIENKLAENFANELKNLQKEGLFENIKSFDLDFNGKGINIKLNESRPGNRNAAHRYESFKKFSNLKENESSEVTYMQDFSIEDYYNDITEVEAAASELGISIDFYKGSGNDGWDEICATASSEEVLKQFLYDWDLIENDDDFEAGLL